MAGSDLVHVHIFTLPLILTEWILLRVTKALTANTSTWAAQANRAPRHFLKQMPFPEAHVAAALLRPSYLLQQSIPKALQA